MSRALPNANYNNSRFQTLPEMGLGLLTITRSRRGPSTIGASTRE